MALTTDLITTAMAQNRNTPNITAAQAELNIANAIIATIKTLNLGYTAGLVAPPGGGPVTGVLTGVIIS